MDPEVNRLRRERISVALKGKAKSTAARLSMQKAQRRRYMPSYAIAMLEADPDLRWCPQCSSCKSYTEFYSAKRNQPDRVAQHTVFGWCKPCSAIKERAAKLKRFYGLTTEALEDMLRAQNDCCAICGQPFKSARKTNIDHDHFTGKTRGVLCQDCNYGLGFFHDDQARLVAAISYLAKHKRLATAQQRIATDWTTALP